MALSRTELEKLSLFYLIKEGILAREFSQELQNIPLVYDPSLYDGLQRTDYKIINPASTMTNFSIADGRGLLSFDLNEINPCKIYDIDSGQYISTYNTPFQNQSYNIPQERESDYISVKDQYGITMDRSWYQIDYNRGRIRFPAPTTPSGVVSSGLTPSSIDYRFHYVSVLDGWPTDSKIPELPFVSVYKDLDEGYGLQIGPGVKFCRDYIIDVFATSSQERSRILDTLYQGLYNKHCPVIDFNRIGQPLEAHGVINENFIQTINFNGKNYRSYLTLNPGNGDVLYFVNVEIYYDTSPRSTMSQSMRHMGKIKLKTKSFSDRDASLVGKFSGLEEPPGGFDSLITKSYLA